MRQKETAAHAWEGSVPLREGYVRMATAALSGAPLAFALAFAQDPAHGEVSAVHGDFAMRLLTTWDMDLTRDGRGGFIAEAWGNLRSGVSIRGRAYGETRETAIYRCFLECKLGECVDIPESLL